MASKKKKFVSKDDLRRLMREKQAVSKTHSKKIDHPLAKYNTLDQLVCVLCNCVIKGELLWPAHLQSRGHKEHLLERKSKQGDVTGVKRKAEEDSSLALLKKFKDKENRTKKGLADSNSVLSSSVVKPKSILAHYSSSEEEEDEDQKSNAASSKETPSTSALPADFFDNGFVPPTSTSKPAKEAKPSAISDILPEGFFDDPKMDAKVRQVEYVDKMEEEWDSFQKAMKEEAHVSEAIVDEDEEQANVDRNIDEIDEQIQYWKEVNDLQNKKDEIMKNGPQDGKVEEDSDEELDESKLEEFLDWRSKKSMR